MLNENYLYMCMLYKLGTIAPSVVVLSIVAYVIIVFISFMTDPGDKSFGRHNLFIIVSRILCTVLIIFVPIWLFAPSEEDIKAYKEHLISENKLYSK